MKINERVKILRRKLQEELGEDDEYAVIGMQLICDGCGRILVLGAGPKAEIESKHWTLGDFGAGEDYCPGCMG